MTEAHPLRSLMDQLMKLPGVGEKSAQRLAFSFLSWPKTSVDTFASVLSETRHQIRYCKICFNISYEEMCTICSNPSRDERQLCVVCEPKDLFAIERAQCYKGRYHVLGGLISPIDGIHPEALRIQELVERLRLSAVTELILAINSTIEGEATGLYLANLLAPLSLKITKLAHGLPSGSDIDYADEVTLQKSLLGRQPI